MRIELLTQPDVSSRTLHEFVSQCLGDPSISRFVAVSAWVKHRALSRIVPMLRAFRARPGRAEIIVGINEGGATEQGLRLAAAEFDRASVFFTTDDRTFHPKLYFASGVGTARLLIGSNNLTPGGLFFNYETALAIELAPGIAGADEDQALAQAVESYIDRLYNDTAVCIPLLPNLEAIIRDPTYRVHDEAAPRSRQGLIPLDPDADREDVQRPALFGRSSSPTKPRVPPGDPIPPSQVAAPAAPSRGRGSRAARPGGPNGPPAPPVDGPAPVGRSNARHRWFRRLDATAAQHPPNPASSPTGNLRLAQAGHGIDQTTYFRNVLFGGLAWAAHPVPQGIRETVTLPIETVIDGRSLGNRDFVVSHADYREADQGNVTTVLHLGPLANEFRATDYTGRIITLEQLSSGAYRLTIDTVETGPFVA
jgi:hypothetical protein